MIFQPHYVFNFVGSTNNCVKTVVEFHSVESILFSYRNGDTIILSGFSTIDIQTLGLLWDHPKDFFKHHLISRDKQFSAVIT